MRTVRLCDTGLTCSALGFGCANLMGRVGRRQSLAALATAHDAGVTLFDTARSYGWGESEAVLGRFAHGRRDRMVIVTKFGILPPPRNRWRQAIKPVARGLLSLAARVGVPGVAAAVRGQIQQRVSSRVQYGRFDRPTAEASVRASLAALRTDYIDLLLMHSPAPDQLADDDLAGFLEHLVRAGVVRAVGVSAGPPAAVALCGHSLVQAVQFENNLAEPRLSGFAPLRSVGVLTNAPFGGRPLVERVVAAAPAGSPATTPDGAGRLLLRYAFAANPGGVVICGMHTSEHIRRNASVAAEPPVLDPLAEHVGRSIRATG